MYTRKFSNHNYDPQCSCKDCSDLELDLQDMIRREHDYRPHWAELSVPITDNTFKK